MAMMRQRWDRWWRNKQVASDECACSLVSVQRSQSTVASLISMAPPAAALLSATVLSDILTTDVPAPEQVSTPPLPLATWPSKLSRSWVGVRAGLVAGAGAVAEAGAGRVAATDTLPSGALLGLTMRLALPMACRGLKPRLVTWGEGGMGG